MGAWVRVFDAVTGSDINGAHPASCLMAAGIANAGSSGQIDVFSVPSICLVHRGALDDAATDLALRGYDMPSFAWAASAGRCTVASHS